MLLLESSHKYIPSYQNESNNLQLDLNNAAVYVLVLL